jgi:hypothetical protein
MEACGSSHYWARELSKPGNVVKLKRFELMLDHDNEKKRSKH